MNSFTSFFRSLLLVLLMVWLPNVVRADNHDDLQEFINNAAAMQTRANDIIEVDLSNFSATTRDKVLEISTGKKYYCCPIKLENSIFTLAHACV